MARWNLVPLEQSTKPYPFETVRHRYVTPFGGRSKDLKGSEVGIDREALEANTDLVPQQDSVTITVLGHSSSRPLYFQQFFTVVALDEEKPDALSKSPRGEAVLPGEDWEVIRRPHLQPGYGDPLLLNVSATKLLGTDPREGMLAAIAKLLKEGSGE
jgi:hypothetical protein